ncbi:MAG: NUDIX hydrolase [Roseinatronobacter sp.]
MNTVMPSLGNLLAEPHNAAFTQVAALCVRDGDAGADVLLVQTLRLRQWVIPKGWPMPGLSLAESAACEAWEEAGIRGNLHLEIVGYFTYSKIKKSGLPIRCRAHVFRIDVTSVADEFPEGGKRVRSWQPTDRAARMVRDPELAAILRAL